MYFNEVLPKCRNCFESFFSPIEECPLCGFTFESTTSWNNSGCSSLFDGEELILEDNWKPAEQVTNSLCRTVSYENWKQGYGDIIEPSTTDEHFSESRPCSPTHCYNNECTNGKHLELNPEDFCEYSNIELDLNKTIRPDEDIDFEEDDEVDVDKEEDEKNVNIVLARFNGNIFQQEDIVKENTLFCWVSALGRNKTVLKYFVYIYPVSEQLLRSFVHVDRLLPKELLILLVQHDTLLDIALKRRITFSSINDADDFDVKV